MLEGHFFINKKKVQRIESASVRGSFSINKKEKVYKIESASIRRSSVDGIHL